MTHDPLQKEKIPIVESLQSQKYQQTMAWQLDNMAFHVSQSDCKKIKFPTQNKQYITISTNSRSFFESLIGYNFQNRPQHLIYTQSNPPRFSWRKNIQSNSDSR